MDRTPYGYPQIIHFNEIFPCKPSILGTPIYGNLQVRKCHATAVRNVRMAVSDALAASSGTVTLVGLVCTPREKSPFKDRPSVTNDCNITQQDMYMFDRPSAANAPANMWF